MENKQSNFSTDKLIAYYQNLPQEKKKIINLIATIFLVLFTIRLAYQFGEKIGQFWYYLTH